MDQGEDHENGQGASGEKDRLVTDTGGKDLGAEPKSSAERIELDMSDDLKKALEEAEQAVEKPRPAPAEDDASPAAEPEQGEAEEVDIDIDSDIEDDEAREGAAAGEEEKFDPNKVEKVEDKAPPPPSPAEMKLKMEILDLRGKVRDLEKAIETRAKEIKQNRDQAAHIQKQFDAHKGRVQKERSDWFNYGHEPLFKEILPVIDNLERALAHAGGQADAQAVTEGVQMTLRMFLASLKKFGVEPIESMGKPFDPAVHQAMAQIESDSAPANTVIEEHQKGYTLKDRLLRPAMVVVSKAPAGAEPPPSDSAPAPAQEQPGPEGSDSDEDKQDGSDDQ